MSKAVRFHAEAHAELAAETAYYESKVPGLGERFLNEIEAATEVAREFPEMGSPFKFDTRRVFPKKFPLSIAFIRMRSSSSQWLQIHANQLTGAIERVTMNSEKR